MKFTINTPVLQEMLSKAVKGASNDNQRPLTGLIAIELKDNILRLITSSESNYLYVCREKTEGEDFYVVVPVEIFSKLVSKLTAEKTTLELQDSNLVITSGGKYTIEVSIDEEGELTRYPDPFSKITTVDARQYKVKKSTLGLILAVNSASIADGEIAKDLPEVYTGYHLYDSIVTTDTIKMCGIKIPICDEPMLLRASTMKLTELFTEENLVINVFDKEVVIMSEGALDCIIVSKVMDDIEDFQIDALNNLLASEFDSMCAVGKTKLLQILDRLSLFIDKLDDYGVYLTFTKDGLQMSNKKSSSEELLPYETSDNFKPYKCKVDIKMLIDQVKAAPGDLVSIEYGNDTCLKFVDGNVTQLVALLDI